MDLLNSEPGSSNKTRVTSTVDGKELTGIEAEMVSDVSEVADQETTIPAIKTEPNEQMASALLSNNRRKDVCTKPSVTASEPASISDLPDDILLQILTYFGPEDIALVIAKVCKKWNELAKDVVLWKKLTYRCDRSPDINRITEGLSGEPVRLITDSCQHLKKLNLDGVRGIDDNDVIYVIKKLGKQLTTLVLEGNHLTDDSYLYFINCARLKELKLVRCSKMTDRGLLEGIGSLQQLTSLHLHVCHKLTDQALSTFLHRRSMTSMVSLELSGCPSLNDEGLKGIAERCIGLKELTVCSCNYINDVGISMVISHCSQLRVLDLICLKHITGEGWLALVPSCLKHLRVLCLEDCVNVCDKYVEELVAAVPELKVIK